MARRIASLHRSEEIRLAGDAPSGGALGRFLRRQQPGSAKLLVFAGGLLIDGHPAFPGKLEIPLGSVQRAVVDDGSGWAYTTAACRFPVFDRRPDGSGTGALVGPLWSTSPSLMPDGCPVMQLAPVPVQAPNIALIFDPCVAISAEDAPGGAGGSVGAMFLCAEDPDIAAERLGARLQVGPLGLDILDYLKRPNRLALDVSGGEASAASS
jgi:hypothetical protein